MLPLKACIPKDKLTTRKWVGAELEPGTYVLSIVDENLASSTHYSLNDKSSGGTCVPLAYKFEIIPVTSKPAILVVHPSPSYPLPYGLPVVV